LTQVASNDEHQAKGHAHPQDSRAATADMVERNTCTMEEVKVGAPGDASTRKLRSWPSPVRARGQVPVIGRTFPTPAAAKVPEIIFLFWVVKILTIAGGEATSDYLKTWGNQGCPACRRPHHAVRDRRYRAFAYWFLAYSIAIFGTGASDFLHLDVKIPCAGTTLLWAVTVTRPDIQPSLNPPNERGLRPLGVGRANLREVRTRRATRSKPSTPNRLRT
jgi:hypothetical protein